MDLDGRKVVVDKDDSRDVLGTFVMRSEQAIERLDSIKVIGLIDQRQSRLFGMETSEMSLFRLYTFYTQV